MWQPPFTLPGTYINCYNINVTKGGKLVNITNVDNTTTKWSYCPDEFGEYNISIAAVNNMGEGDIITMTLFSSGK